uniref:Uncharacterized protein n=1 Tax=Arundo donax TaxID=35708 RepID=A0A0A9EI23_ARUDO
MHKVNMTTNIVDHCAIFLMCICTIESKSKL